MDIEIKVSFVVPDDEAHLLPIDIEAVAVAATGAMVPAIGDYVFLTPRSSWLVIARSWDYSADGAVHLLIQLHHQPEGLALKRPPRPTLLPPVR